MEGTDKSAPVETQAPWENLRKLASRIDRLDRKLKPAVRYVESSAIAHLVGYSVALLSLASIIMTLVQVQIDLSAQETERAVQQEERVERAWTRLMMPIGGNMGKGYALNLVLQDGTDLNALDLSCKNVGTWNEKTQTCEKPPIFDKIKIDHNGLNLTDYKSAMSGDIEPYFKKIRDDDAINIDAFNMATVVSSSFSGSYLDSFEADELMFFNTDFSLTYWENIPKKAGIYLCDLSFAMVNIDFYAATPLEWIDQCNVSGMTVQIADTRSMEKIFGPHQVMSNGHWAWADIPPMSYDTVNISWKPAPLSVLNGIAFCDPIYRTGGPPSPGASPVSSIVEAARGLRPQIAGIDWNKLKDGLDTEEGELFSQACPDSMDWKAAAALYPDRYPKL